MSSSYRMELDRWLAELDVKAERVLDIGGSQLPIKGRTKSWEVKDYFIGDLEEPHVNSPSPQLIIDLNEPMQAIDQMKFDVVFCLEVMDYVYNPINALWNIYDFMKIGATAWVTFPSFYPLHQPVEDDALRYMPAGIEKLAKESGLTIIEMIPRRTETDAIYQAFRTERMRCAKNEDHNISGWIVELKK